MKKHLLILSTVNIIAWIFTYSHAQTNTRYGTGALFSNTTGTYNSAFGYQALYYNKTGSRNTAIGFNALKYNTQGTHNTATGTNALFSNTSGSANTAYGRNALYSNTTGYDNSAIGHNALYYNIYGTNNTAVGSHALHINTGDNNTAVGSLALVSNSEGYNNTAVGFRALYSNTTGAYNTAIGWQSLYFNTTGQHNIAIGGFTMYSNTTGSDNTAIGEDAMVNNTTGFYNTSIGQHSFFSNTTGYNNIVTGTLALYFNTTGYNNVATGVYALHNNTTGLHNTGIGYAALLSNTTGVHNVAVGPEALRSNTKGSRNTALGDSAGAAFNFNYATFVGYKTSAAVNGLTNITALGHRASATASNQVRLGNSAVTSIGGQVSWTTLSDGRFKRNIQEDVPGLSFIKKLRPVTYTLDADAVDEATGISEKLTDEEKLSRSAAEKERHTGFVAQEVDKAATEIKYEFGGIDRPKNNNDFYGLRYAEFVVPLVKAVQELSEENTALKNEIKEMKEQLNRVEALSEKNNNSNIDRGLSSIVLQQNAPNPFKGSTRIEYNIPLSSNNARISITDMKGKIVKILIIKNGGQGQVNVTAGMLSPGAYTYTLYVDGKYVDAREMIVAR